MAGGDTKAPAGSPAELRRNWDEYATGRNKYLRTLGMGSANRDPGHEFAEHLVASLVGGGLAINRVQPGWDVKRPDGRRIQVRTLWNIHESVWPNEHTIRFPDNADEYALVIFLNHRPRWIIVLGREAMPYMRALLNKRNRDESEMTLTAANLAAMRENPGDFAEIGVKCVAFPQTGWIDVKI